MKRSALGFALALALGGCRGSEAESPPRCGGEERPQLDCSTEFNYDSTTIAGGFTALGIGAMNASTEQKALREIDQETARYAAQTRRLCDEYNKCVIDRETYAVRSENLRRRLGKVPELYEALKSAGSPEAQRAALAAAYREIVPEDTRVELSVGFAVSATRPSELSAKPIREGDSLPSGSRVSFWVEVSRPAYVYLAQRSGSGRIDVLFPDARITVRNPLPAHTQLRIPHGGAEFKLDSNTGTERVYLVASLTPLASLDHAMSAAASGQAPSAPLERLSHLGETSDCRHDRALSFDEAPARNTCSRQRGLSFEPAAGSFSAPASTVVRTEAADTMIARVFTFQHVAP
jgi:hypothetical protein